MTDHPSLQEILRQNEDLRAQLMTARETLRRICSADTDAFVCAGPEDNQTSTFKDAESAYRILIEAMNDYALVLAADGSVINCNASFARMVDLPQDQIIGSRIHHLVLANDPAPFDKSLAEGKQPEQTLKQNNTALFTRMSDYRIEQKEAEDALRESEERLHMALQCGHGGAWDWNLETSEAWWSSEMYDLLGVAPGARITLESTLALIFEEDREPLRAALEESLAECREYTFEYRICHPTRGMRWISNNGRPVCDEQGRPVRLVGIALDITERRQAEEALRKYKLLSESTKDIILFVGLDGRIIEANQAAVCAYGYSREEMLNLKIFDLRVTSPEAYTLDQMAAADERGIVFETIHRRKDGSVFNAEVSLHGADVGGERVLMSIVRDITERRRTEESLRKSEGRLRTVLESITDGYYVLDGEWRFVELNTIAERHFGHSSAELQGKGIWQFASTSTESPIYQQFHRSVAEGRFISFEAQSEIHPDYWSELHLYPRDGMLEVYFRDISRRKHAEQELGRAKDLLQQQVYLLQRALIPAKPEVIEGYSVGSAYIPAYEGTEIGGDFLDVFKTEEGKVGILIGDVSGKGIESAALAATTRSTVRAFAYESSSPGDALSHANRLITAHQDENVKFVTSFLAILDTATGAVRFSSAGHPPAIVGHEDGSTEMLYTSNMPLGVMADIEYVEGGYTLEIGDRLVLCTDGITEARHDQNLFGIEGLERVLSANCETCPDELIEAILAAIKDWAHGRLRDDTAVMVVSRDLQGVGAPST